MLGANLNPDEPDHAEDEAVSQELHSKPVDARKAGGDSEDVGMETPIGGGKPYPSQQEQMRSPQHAGKEDLHNCRATRKLEQRRFARPHLPKTTGDASPPTPQDDAVQQRGQMGYGMAFAGGGQGEGARKETNNGCSAGTKPVAGGLAFSLGDASWHCELRDRK